VVNSGLYHVIPAPSQWCWGHVKLKWSIPVILRILLTLEVKVTLSPTCNPKSSLLFQASHVWHFTMDPLDRSLSFYPTDQRYWNSMLSLTSSTCL
jgi:hypothetical protein